MPLTDAVCRLKKVFLEDKAPTIPRNYILRWSVFWPKSLNDFILLMRVHLTVEWGFQDKIYLFYFPRLVLQISGFYFPGFAPRDFSLSLPFFPLGGFFLEAVHLLDVLEGHIAEGNIKCASHKLKSTKLQNQEEHIYFTDKGFCSVKTNIRLKF